VIAAALAMVLGAGCPTMSVDGALGAELARQTSGVGSDASFVWGGALLAELEPCVRLPFAAELTARVSTMEAADGVDAVQVDSWASSFGLAAGLSWPLIGRDTRQLSGLLLVGPQLRMTRTTVEVYEESTGSTSFAVFAATTIGAMMSFDKLRISPRVVLSLPGWHPAVMLNVGLQLD
jgi:hypothetical protein